MHADLGRLDPGADPRIAGTTVRSARGIALMIAVGLALVSALPARALAQTQGATPGRWLRLNIPAYRLDIMDDSTTVRSYRVAIGMRAYATPVGTFAVHEIIWNPSWVPPKAEWAKHDTVTPPGPLNPVGKVKLPFDRLVFLHGTPFASTIGHAASHACVRMTNRDAIALALEMQRRDSTSVSTAAMDSILTRWDVTRFVQLRSPIRFEVVYRLAEVRDSVLMLYPDVYRRDTVGLERLALVALAAAGTDTSRVARAALGRSARRARLRAVTVPLAALVPARP